MDILGAAGELERLLVEAGNPGSPLVFEPGIDAHVTRLERAGVEVAVGVGPCEEGGADLLLSVAVGSLPNTGREDALVRLLQWNHCATGAGHYSLVGETIHLVNRRPFGGIDAAALSVALDTVAIAGHEATAAVAAAELSGGLPVG